MPGGKHSRENGRKPKRNQQQILKDRARVARMHLEGYTQQEIAADIGVSQPTISNDIKAIESEWKQSAIRDFDAEKASALMKLDRIWREAWKQFRESFKDLKKSVVSIERRPVRRGEQTVQEPQVVGETVTTQTPTTGSANYLRIMLDTLKERNTVLGLDSPGTIKAAEARMYLDRMGDVVTFYVPPELRDAALDYLDGKVLSPPEMPLPEGLVDPESGPGNERVH